MFIKYHWENVECNVLDNDDNALEPTTHKEIRDVDYEFNVNVTVKDLVQYLMPYNLTHKFNKTREDTNEISLAKFYMTKALEFMLEHGVDPLDFDIALEDDECFVEYMRDRYEEQAFEEWNEYYNEEY